LRSGDAVACAILLFLASAFALAQTGGNQGTRPGKTPDEPNEITVDGCLYGSQGNFQLVNADNGFNLRGNVSALQKYVGDEVMVRGKQEGSDHLLSLLVSSVTEVFKAPKVELSKKISNPSNWHFQANELYGVRFAVPAFPEDSVGGGSVFPNFVSETGTITLGGLPIPAEMYPGTNFVGGTYLFTVNPQVKNRESCERFGTSDPRFLSHRTFAGTQYAKLTAGDAAMGTSYEDVYFHAFQNGMCYEVAFSFGEYNTSSQDFGCRVSKAGDTDKVVEEFMQRISYSRLATASLPEHPSAVPKVTSFAASSTIVNGGTDRGATEFSWTTENADYVEFSYHCSAVGLGLVILEQGGAGGRNCENDPKPITPQTQQVNHPPNSALEVAFGNAHHDDPISIVVTLTPFSHGKAYPSASRSLTIRVDPRPPFPEGIPSETDDLTLTYSGGAQAAYQQGSSLTISWTDTLYRVSCFGLYLVQEGTGRPHYVAQIVYKCQPPAASGSYDWTIPDKYSGSGFRIYAAAWGRMSSALGPAFSIVGPNSKVVSRPSKP